MTIIYIVYENGTDLCFFEGEAEDKEHAIKLAEKEYYDHYPENKGKDIQFYVDVIDTDDE